MLAFLLATALVGTTPAVPVSVTLNQNGRYLPGSGVQVTVQPGADGYLLVLNADPDGRVRVLFPLDPTDDAFVRGGRKYQLEDRGGRNTAFVVDWSSGSGTIFAALSKDPLQPGDFALNGHWDYRNLTLSSDDDEVALRSLAERIAPGGVQYDFSKYFIGASDVGFDGVQAGFDGGQTVVAVGLGVGWGMGWGMGWGWGWGGGWWGPGWGWGWGPAWGWGPGWGGGGGPGGGGGGGRGGGGGGWGGGGLLLGRRWLGKHRRRNHSLPLARADADMGWSGSSRHAARRSRRAGDALGSWLTERRLSQSQRRCAWGTGNTDESNFHPSATRWSGANLWCSACGRLVAPRRERPVGGGECQSRDRDSGRPRCRFTAGEHGQLPSSDEHAGLPCPASWCRCGHGIE